MQVTATDRYNSMSEKKKKKEASWYDIMRRVIRVDPGILELSIHSVSGASGAKFVTREHPEQLAFLP